MYLRPQHCGYPSDYHTQLFHDGATLLTPRVVTSCLQTPQNLLEQVSDHEGASCEWWVGCCCFSQILVSDETLPSELDTYDMWLLMGEAVRTCSVAFLHTHPFPAAGPSSPHVPRCEDRSMRTAASYPTWVSEACEGSTLLLLYICRQQ